MNDDRRLRELFSELSARDAREAPEFASLLRAQTGGSRRRPRRLAISVSLGTVAAVATAVVLLRPSTRPAAPPISSWTSPTASLLPLSSPLLDRAPKLGETWLDLEKEVPR